jgi:hypothetical protein
MDRIPLGGKHLAGVHTPFAVQGPFTCRSADLPIVPVGVSITLVFFTIRGRKD